jgi:hypothetical protein
MSQYVQKAWFGPRVTHMNHVDVLVGVLKTRFSHVAPRHDYGWPEKPALCVLDCVLSLNRRYDKVVYPRVLAFSRCHPEVVQLAQLHARLDAFANDGEFFHQCLDYNDIQRERTLRGVVKYLLTVQARHAGESEWERLRAWAVCVRPSEHRAVNVRGFALAGFQYLRMLFGVQTTKPDVHIVQFVSKALGRRVSAVTALALLETAANQAELPLREVDGAIWDAGACKKAGPASSHCSSRRQCRPN